MVLLPVAISMVAAPAASNRTLPPNHLPESMRLPDTMPPEELVAAPCPCSPSSLCDPVTAVHATEVYGMLSGLEWKQWDAAVWSSITTIAGAPFPNPEIICMAHKHDIRVVGGASLST